MVETLVYLMQKKVKITIAHLWVGVVSFFQADGISRMRNKMENEMKTITDEQRLNWLIDNGAYTAIDHDEYWGLTNEERRSEMRNRVDKFISKELNANDNQQVPLSDSSAG